MHRDPFSYFPLMEPCMQHIDQHSIILNRIFMVLSMFSSSSDDSDDYSTRNFEEPVKRKRRRKSRRKLEAFLENLVMKVMEKQEQMHKLLIEMIEKREKERIIREETWKQQEMERMKRDEEIRAQETSRNLALISLIQNVLGQEIFQIPQVEPVVFQWMEENGAETDSLQPDMKCDPNNKRWPEGEVQALIATRTSLEHKFRITGSKGSIWEEVSVEMCNMGYNRTARKCKEKWENINKYFKRSMASDKNRSRPYFHDLELLYNNGVVNPGNCFSIASNEKAAKNEKD